VFENRVLRRIFGPKREEVAGKWRRLRNEELHNLCPSQNFIRLIKSRRREGDGSWRKLHNDELHNLYSSPNIVRVIKSRRMRWARYVARMGDGRGVKRVLVRRPEGKRALGRPRRRWEDNIKMGLGEIGIDGANCIRLAQGRVQ
jgi:hypothetical protein